MYTKLNLLPAKVTSKYGANPVSKLVAFFGNRTVATDTFRMLEVQAQLTDDGYQQPVHDPVFIQPELLKKVKLKKGETATLADIENATGATPNPHFQYPDIDQVLDRAEKEPEYTELRVNGRLLGELLIAMSKSNGYEQVVLRVPDAPYKPIYAYTEKGEQRMRGLCMPMNR